MNVWLKKCEVLKYLVYIWTLIVSYFPHVYVELCTNNIFQDILHLRPLSLLQVVYNFIKGQEKMKRPRHYNSENKVIILSAL